MFLSVLSLTPPPSRTPYFMCHASKVWQILRPCKIGYFLGDTHILRATHHVSIE